MTVRSDPVGLVDTLRVLPRAVWVLLAGSFINRFGSFVVPFLLLYLTRSGYSPAQAGMVIGAYGLGQVCASVLGGYLTDRIGTKWTIASSMFSAGATIMALSAAEGLWLLAFLIFCVGLTAELYRPASAALIANLVDPPHRVTAYAAYRFAINAGFAAGPAMAGLLADGSFFWLFLGNALTSCTFGVIALAALPSDGPPRPAVGAPATAPPGSAQPDSVAAAGFLSIASDRALMRFLVASTLLSLIFFQYQSTFALHVRDIGLSNAIYGMLISINGAVVVLFEVPVTAITRRLRAQPVIATGFVLTGLGFALTGMAGGVITLAVTVALWSFGEVLAAPVASAHVAELAPAHLRGRYMGIYNLNFSLGVMLGPGIGTWIYMRSASALWISCGVVGVLGAALVLWRGSSVQDKQDERHGRSR